MAPETTAETTGPKSSDGDLASVTETWVVTWVAVQPGSAQLAPFASMYNVGGGAEAARRTEHAYGHLARFRILVMHKLS